MPTLFLANVSESLSPLWRITFWNDLPSPTSSWNDCKCLPSRLVMFCKARSALSSSCLTSDTVTDNVNEIFGYCDLKIIPVCFFSIHWLLLLGRKYFEHVWAVSRSHAHIFNMLLWPCGEVAVFKFSNGNLKPRQQSCTFTHPQGRIGRTFGRPGVNSTHFWRVNER